MFWFQRPIVTQVKLPAFSRSADAAFVTAFKRLPKELSLEVTKALAVKVSSLVDSNKNHAYTEKWSGQMGAYIDMIQLLFSQSAAGLQHFYELLLARRLVRDRYASLSMERRMLAALPAMSKASLMLQDVESSAATMVSFRNYMVAQSDSAASFGSGCGPLAGAALNLVLTDGVRVKLLTKDVWPSFSVNLRSFQGVRLPPGRCSVLLL